MLIFIEQVFIEYPMYVSGIVLGIQDTSRNRKEFLTSWNLQSIMYNWSISLVFAIHLSVIRTMTPTQLKSL